MKLELRLVFIWFWIGEQYISSGQDEMNRCEDGSRWSWDGLQFPIVGGTSWLNDMDTTASSGKIALRRGCKNFICGRQENEYPGKKFVEKPRTWSATTAVENCNCDND